jgi:formylmethanofuran dehydrogenase subunit E
MKNELLEAAKEVLEWAAMMGGWEAPCWGRLQKAVDAEKPQAHVSCGYEYVACRFCGDLVLNSSSRLHQDGWVCDKCWDERLRTTE